MVLSHGKRQGIVPQGSLDTGQGLEWDVVKYRASETPHLLIFVRGNKFIPLAPLHSK